MTDNRTTEKLLREFVAVACECEVRDYLISEYAERIEQAIAATLGSGNCARCAEDMGRYADSLCDPLKERIAELLRCLETDWNIRASWDGLRKFWCIELTDEGIRMRDAAHGTLIAEQVREAIERHGTASLGCRWQFTDRNLQTIADELNAALGGWECVWTLKEKWPNRSGDDHVYGYETSCGARHTWWPDSLPNFCPTCGGRVKAVER